MKRFVISISMIFTRYKPGIGEIEYNAGIKYADFVLSGIENFR